MRPFFVSTALMTGDCAETSATSTLRFAVLSSLSFTVAVFTVTRVALPSRRLRSLTEAVPEAATASPSTVAFTSNAIPVRRSAPSAFCT